MAAIKNLSIQNRTVICTIHQPSPDSFEAFDMLILMAAGKLIYMGPCNQAVSYFVQSPFRFDYVAGVNPADFVVAVAGSFMKSSEGKVVTGEDLVAYYDSIHGGRKSDKRIEEMAYSNPNHVVKLSFPNTFMQQLLILYGRYSKVFYRNRVSQMITIGR